MPPLSSEACTECGGSGWRDVAEGVARCDCHRAKRRAALLSRIAPRDRWASLEGLGPCAALRVPLATQSKLLAQIRARPDASYFLVGPTGTGKTTLQAALYRHAVDTQGSVSCCIYVQLVDLLHQLRFAELGRDVIPIITAERISELHLIGVRPRIFLDEFDKASPTEFARNSIHRLIDEAYRMAGRDGAGVQLVVCTNLTRNDLGDAWGAPILRRLEETCLVVDYFEAMVPTA